MGHDEDLNKQAEDDELDMDELLYDFGGKLKGSTLV